MKDAVPTPGPWHVAARAACVMAKGDEFDSIGVADCRSVDCDVPTQYANACLVAAAPDLLAACERLLYWLQNPVGEVSERSRYDCGPHQDEAILAAHAAIAKAKGGA